MMVTAMRWIAFVLLPMLSGAVEIGGSDVRTIYIMPMRHGLDQYLANQLTRENLVEVIADPARADAIFTDGLGETFEQQLEKPHPTPKPAPPKAEAKTGESGADSGKEQADKDKKSGPNMYSDPEPPHVSTFGRGKGTLFLVDARSRVVLWSVYEKPVTSTPRNLDGTAKRVVNQLKQDLAAK